MIKELLTAVDEEKDVDVQTTMLESLAGMCRLCWRIKPAGGAGPAPL